MVEQTIHDLCKLVAYLGQSYQVCQGDIIPKGLLGFATLFFQGKACGSAHIVQPVGQLDLDGFLATIGQFVVFSC